MEAALAKPNWGLKRTCLNCSERFYDMKRDPIICPNCGAEFDPLALVKSRRARATSANQAKTTPKHVVESAETDANPEGEDVGVDENLEVDTDEIDIGDDDDDLISDPDELDEDLDVSEALENAKDDRDKIS